MKTHRSPHSGESGQAIFVIALIMVALIGALGLAVDGGGMALMYRDAQNAADSAALAAAYARCTNGNLATITSAALASAEDNGFVTGGTTQINVVQGADPNFISVSVRAVKPAYFIQLLYPRGLEVTAAATAQCTPAVSGTQATSDNAVSVVGLGQTGGVSATCHGTCEAVEGMNLILNASVYSTTGATSDIGYTNRSVGWTGGATPVTNAPSVDPLAYLNIADYAPNGAIWNNIPSTHRTYLQMTTSGPATVPNFTYAYNSTLAYGSRPAQNEWRVVNPQLLGGLYYVEGNIVLDLNHKTTQPFTIVATGRIDILNASKGISAYPQASNILAFTTAPSDSCNDNALAIDTTSTNSGASRGIVYAPNGQIEVLYQGGSFNGSIVGKWVDWWGYSSSAKTTFTAFPLTTPPIVALVS